VQEIFHFALFGTTQKRLPNDGKIAGMIAASCLPRFYVGKQVA
jgi:hypothetical protein